MKPRSSTREIALPVISAQSHRYYRGVIMPAIREYCGYESDALAHRALKSGFFDKHPDDPALPSMAAMSQDEASRFMEYALRQAAEMGCVIADPQPSEIKPMAPAKSEIKRDGDDDCSFAVGPVGR